MRTVVYIDGFNLYYRALKYTTYKWLNIATMCEQLLKDQDPKYQIVRIKYYTAKIQPFPDNLQAPTRQQFYLRALATLPNVQVIFGNYMLHTTWARLAKPTDPANPWVEILKPEEKGSDVNLASHMIRDGFRDFYDAAMVITNDSDLAEPISIVARQLKKEVGILNPAVGKKGRELKKYATFIKDIEEPYLRDNQFPDAMNDKAVNPKGGLFHKPTRWNKAKPRRVYPAP